MTVNQDAQDKKIQRAVMEATTANSMVQIKSFVLNMPHRLFTDDPVWYIFIIVDDSLVKSSWSLSQFAFE
jgi:hypothetical protein